MISSFKNPSSSPSQPLQSSSLRHSIASYYSSLNKFQLKKPADSIEALCAILEFIHYSYISENPHSQNNCHGNCTAHRLFHLEMIEQYTCQCGCSSEVIPWDYCSFSLQVYIDDLVANTSTNDILDYNDDDYIKNSLAIKSIGILPEYIRSQLLENFVPVCPEKPTCEFKKSVRTIYIVNQPEIFIINLVWRTKPRALQTLKVLASVQERMEFRQIMADTNDIYYAKSYVFYNGYHYISYVWDQSWWRCDDNIVREIFGKKEMVMDIIRSGMWPVAVLYDRRHMESQEPSIKDWIELEKTAIVNEIEANFQNAVAYWRCSCGSENEDFLLYCLNCSKNKLTDAQWNCLSCGALNGESSVFCQQCRSFSLGPTRSSLHSKLFSQDFYFSSRPQVSQTYSTQIDREKHFKEVPQHKSQNFISSRENISDVIRKNTALKNSGVNFSAHQPVKAYASADMYKNRCSSCNSFCQPQKNLCNSCIKTQIYCEICKRVFTKNGQRCNCDLAVRGSRTGRF